MVSTARAIAVSGVAAAALVAVLGASAVAIAESRESTARAIGEVRPAPLDSTAVDKLRESVEQQEQSRNDLTSDLKRARLALAAAEREKAASPTTGSAGAVSRSTGRPVSRDATDDERDAAEDARDDAADAAEDARDDAADAAEDAADDARDAEDRDDD